MLCAATMPPDKLCRDNAKLQQQTAIINAETEAQKKIIDSKAEATKREQEGYTYKMWIEDEDSIRQKLNLIKKYNLTGAAFWQKGFEKDDIWQIVKSQIME